MSSTARSCRALHRCAAASFARTSRLLEAIEARLLDDAPVAAVGMLAVNELLTSPGSCLFADMDDVESSLQAVLDQLEVR